MALGAAVRALTGPPTARLAPRELAGPVTVSVVITCYNYERFLRAAVESALNQQGVAVEVVVVDDCSTDSSLELANRLAAADARVKVVANSENLGAVGAFNRGLDYATGEFLVRLDADDLLTPGSLRRAAAVLQALPNVGLVYGHPLHFSGVELPPPRTEPRWWAVWRGSDWLAARCSDGTNVITSPEVMLRRSVLAEVGGMRPLAHTHDMELWLRVSARLDVAYIRGADQAWHREHPASLSTHAEDPLILLRELRDAFDTLTEWLDPTEGAGRLLRASARRAVARHAVTAARVHLDRGLSGDVVDHLRLFAAETDPTITSTRQWRRLLRRVGWQRLPHPLRVALGAVPRLQRRATVTTRRRRWHRTGVFEPSRTRRAGAGQPAASTPRPSSRRPRL